MVQLSATRCSFIAILCINLVIFADITLCVASQRVFIVVVVVYFVLDSVRKLLDTQSYTLGYWGSFLGKMLPRREADPSSPSSTKDKNAWSYATTRPLHLYGVVLN
jgi:hypothetical protein